MKINVKCPFCGKTNNDYDPETGDHAVGVKTYHSKSDGREMSAASCEWCGANGPLCDTPKEAIAAFHSPEKRAIKLQNMMGEIATILERPASNRRFMQIAGPARECLNIIKGSGG